MPKETSYSISVEERDIVVRFNRGAIDMDALTRFLDYVELEAIAKKSKLTEEQAAALAEEIDRDVWNDMKQNFLGE